MTPVCLIGYSDEYIAFSGFTRTGLAAHIAV